MSSSDARPKKDPKRGKDDETEDKKKDVKKKEKEEEKEPSLHKNDSDDEKKSARKGLSDSDEDKKKKKKKDEEDDIKKKHEEDKKKKKEKEETEKKKDEEEERRLKKKKEEDEDDKKVKKKSEEDEKKKISKDLKDKENGGKDKARDGDREKENGNDDEDGPTVIMEKVEELIHQDAAQLIDHFRKAFDEATKQIAKPNVLITGVTGAGKSSLINAVFGRPLAEVGAGTPITQHFMKYESEDCNVVIFDSKGLEHGNHEAFMQENKDFFEAHKARNTGKTDDCIHVIWYIINSADGRFQPFEMTLCKELFNKSPLIFCLNKADISRDEDREAIRQVIEGMNLANCIGVFDTTSVARCKAIENCSKCGSDDITIRMKKMMFTCNECGHSERLEKLTGLEDVVQATLEILPTVAWEAFISAQSVSFKLKNKRAKKILLDFHEDWKHVRMTSSLLQIITKMLARLSILWDFRGHGHLYGREIGREIVKRFSFKDKLSLLMHKNTEQLNYATALGILWNNSVHNLAESLFHLFEEGIQVSDIETRWPKLWDNAFSVFSEAKVEELENNINEKGLNAVLDAMIPCTPA